MSENFSLSVRDLIAHINTFAPYDLAEEWDNTGLMVGSYDARVSRVGVCMDAVSDAVVEAAERGCQVLLTHHPLIFRPLKKIDTAHDIGRTIQEAMKRDVTIVSAHTNWDKANEGVNVTLGELLGFDEVRELEGFGTYGILPEKMDLEEFLIYVKAAWNLSRLDCFSQQVPEKISRVALCGGAGAEFWPVAKNHRADIYLTADMKYHELIDAVHSGLAVGVADHGEMERASLPKLATKVAGCGVDTVLLESRALPSPLRS